MPGRYQKPREKNSFPLILTSLVLIAIVLFVVIRVAEADTPAVPDSPAVTVPPTDTVTEAPTVPRVTKTSTATFINTGDILMHKVVINSGATGNGYNFDSIFKYVDPYVTEADYGVANLETTLAGTDNGYKYSGYPCFNCPDEIVDGARDAGFDMLLTANNHTNDTASVGINRTLKVIKERGMESLGTNPTAEDPDYKVLDVNGIKVGVVCYTYANPGGTAECPYLNGIPVRSGDANKVNNFDYEHLDRFYSEMTQHIASMRQEGAEALVLYLHWGIEYQLKPNSHQTAIAQKMCDLGIDVIVGGHPHVIQPMELLSSTTDPEHKTVCLYSTGNAVSNQRRNLMNLNDGHTEDGLLFSFTFAKYSDGSVILESADVLPTWVYLRSGEPNEYNIIPLDKDKADWKTAFNLSDNVYNLAMASYDRTMALVGEGLTASNNYLSSAQQAKEAAYEQAVHAA